MKKIKIDTTTHEYPNFISKEHSNPLWITCEVEISKGNIVRGKILYMNSNGQYTVEIEDLE